MPKINSTSYGKEPVISMENRQRNWINKYLTPDENVIWNGRPGKGHLLTEQDIFMLPFGIMWSLFSIILESIVLFTPIFTPTDIVAQLCGIPFVCVGLYLVFGRFILKTYKRRKTVYVITNKRVFFFRNNQVQTLDYHTHLTRKITWHPDGFGSIRFIYRCLNLIIFWYFHARTIVQTTLL